MNFTHGKRIIFASQDAGGAAALLPVIEMMRSLGEVDFKIFADSPGYEVLFHRLKTADGRLHRGFPQEAFIMEADCVITSTSMSPHSLDKQVIYFARAAGIRTATLVDHWCNFAERFSSSAEKKWEFLPDTVFVPDQFALNEAILEGVSPTKISIVGHPSIERALQLKKSPLSDEEKSRIRLELGVAREDKFILFLSQPTEDVCRIRYGDSEFIGYDEIRVLESVLRTVISFRNHLNRSAFILVRPHPAENIDKISVLSKTFGNSRVTRDGELLSLAQAADLIIGMDTEFIVEATALGKITLSLQPGLRNIRDSIPTNRSGLSLPCYEYDGIPGLIEKYLFDQTAIDSQLGILESHNWMGNAIQRVYEAILKSCA